MKLMNSFQMFFKKLSKPLAAGALFFVLSANEAVLASEIDMSSGDLQKPREASDTVHEVPPPLELESQKSKPLELEDPEESRNPRLRGPALKLWMLD